jgi:hypothetical protein
MALAVVSVSAISAVGVFVSLPVCPTGDDCAAPVSVSAEMMQPPAPCENVTTMLPLLPDGLIRYQIAVRYWRPVLVVLPLTASVSPTPPNVTLSTVNAPESLVRNPWTRTTNIRSLPDAGVYDVSV